MKEKLSLRKLRVELKARGLSPSGLKRDLIKRLLDYNTEYSEMLTRIKKIHDGYLNYQYENLYILVEASARLQPEYVKTLTY
jgi:hypothetical protein